MIRRLAIATFSLMVALSQPAVASPKDDAAYIAGKLVTDEFTKSVHDHYVNVVAKLLSRALATRSVEVIDKDEFSHSLTDHITDPSTARLEQITANLLLQKAKPGKLADHLRSMPPGKRPYETDASKVAEDENATLVEKIEATTAVFKDEAFIKDFSLSFVLVGTFFHVMGDAQNFNADIKAPYMADILETDGVFRFPNRIIRNNFIREIRAANP